MTPSDPIVILGRVSERREVLLGELEAYYRGCGWKVSRADDGTVRAAGPGGVTWIGLAVVADDLRDDDFEDRLRALAGTRMQSGGERCPLELLPDEKCTGEVRGVLERLRLSDAVSVYSLAA